MPWGGAESTEGGRVCWEGAAQAPQVGRHRSAAAPLSSDFPTLDTCFLTSKKIIKEAVFIKSPFNFSSCRHCFKGVKNRNSFFSDKSDSDSLRVFDCCSSAQHRQGIREEAARAGATRHQKSPEMLMSHPPEQRSSFPK